MQDGMVFEALICLEDPLGFLSPLAQKLGSFQRVHGDVGHAVLAWAHELSHAPNAQVFRGELETVVNSSHKIEPLHRERRWVVRQKQAVALLRPSTHATSKLVKLSQAEALCALDHHHRGVRNIDSNLDDGRRDTDLYLAIHERAHDFVLVFEAAVYETHPQVGKHVHVQTLKLGRGGARDHRLRLLDQRADDKGLAAELDLGPHQVVSALPVSRRDYLRLHG